MKRRILFVDDEPDLLESLRDSLRPKREQWSMVFAEGGEAALRELAEAPFDVVVSDMRMPGMSGAELLQTVREQHPKTVRLVLSGQSHFDRTVGVAPFAHQFLAKPCSPEELGRVIDRACELQSLLSDVEAQATAAGVSTLPVAPAAYLELTAALGDPDVCAADVGRLVERDIAVFAKMLQLVNSAFFGLGRQISSAQEAVAYLGMSPLRSLVLSVSVMQTFTPPRPIEGFSLERLERHSTMVARTASRLVASTSQAESAFTAGLLHDVGQLVLASEQPERLEALLAEARGIGRPLHEIEREWSGTTHAELGAYLLGLWGLPLPVVDAVARHHAPSAVEQPVLDATAAVALTEALFDELDEEPTAESAGLLAAVPPAIDLGRCRTMVADELARAAA